MTDDRLKMWLSFWKWLISTIVITGGLAWASTIINAKHKDTELRIKINQEEKEYLTSFLERAMDDNLEKRYRFAQYFAHVTSSNEYRQGWSNYFAAIEKEVNSAIAEKSKLESELEEKSGRELAIAENRINELERELSVNRMEYNSPIETQSLNIPAKLFNYKLECPENTSAAVWGDSIRISKIPEIPRGIYIKYGCKTAEGISRGPYVAWYPTGQVISEGVIGGIKKAYYPDGSIAAQTDESERPHRTTYWNTDGTKR